MFERLGTITFKRCGWIIDTYSKCHVYVDKSRILLKYDSFAQTYICSEYNTELNYIFIEQLKAAIKYLKENNECNITLKQLISYHTQNKDEYTTELQSFLVDILPGTQVLYNYENDENFMYMNDNTYLICHDDYTNYFMAS